MASPLRIMVTAASRTRMAIRLFSRGRGRTPARMLVEATFNGLAAPASTAASKGRTRTGTPGSVPHQPFGSYGKASGNYHKPHGRLQALSPALGLPVGAQLGIELTGACPHCHCRRWGVDWLSRQAYREFSW